MTQDPGSRPRLSPPETVTATRPPFLSFTSSPCSSVSVFSMRKSRYRWPAPSIAICAFSGWPRRGGMILATVPGMVVPGCSGIRAVFKFHCAILTDLAMRGSAISFLTLARIALSDSSLLFLCSMRPSWHQDGTDAVPFRTVCENLQQEQATALCKMGQTG